MFANIFNYAHSAVSMSRSALLRFRSWVVEEDQLHEGTSWQEAHHRFSAFDFWSACLAVAFVLFLNLYY